VEKTFHATEDQLERYVLRRLPPRTVAQIEEHLLICFACRERLDSMEEFTLAIRKGLSNGTRAQAGSA
jgi:hypothetical protein